MSWWWRRYRAALGCLALGAMVGGFLASLLPDPALRWVGAVLGALVGLALAVLADMHQATVVLDWLRVQPHRPAPVRKGFWGDMAYRIERHTRQQDVTLQTERERLQQFISAMQASPNGVTLLDEFDALVWANATACDHLSVDLSRDKLQRLTNLVRVPVLVEGLRSGTESLQFYTPRGDRKLAVIVRRFGDGMRLLLSSDITEAERNDAMRTHFVANVSHEIRTPLTVLSGFLESLSTLPLGDEERERVLGLMRQQADRMQALVSDLLTLAQLEGSPSPAVDQWFDLDALWAQVQADTQALSRHQHSVHFDLAAGYQVAGHRAEFLSMVTNLVTNALRYTPAGGRIDVHWRCNQGRGELTVRDNGIGIAPEHLPRITERFYRVDGSRSRETGGTGLGLAIVKHIVRRHGGELLVDSQLGQGSTFRVDLPSARVRLAPASGAAKDSVLHLDSSS